MSDELKKAEAEIAKLQRELERTGACSSTSDAARSIASFVTENEEPFLTDYAQPNKWHQSAGGGGGYTLS